MPNHFNRIFGWFDYSGIYQAALQETQTGIFVELGCFQGKSACWMAESIREQNKDIKLYCVDLWPEKEILDSAELIELGIGQGDEKGIINSLSISLYDVFMNHMKSADLLDIVIPIKSFTWEAASLFEDESVDFVFVDAGHTYDAVFKDLTAWLPKLKTGKFMAGHDWHVVQDAVYDVLGKDKVQTAVCNCWKYVKNG